MAAIVDALGDAHTSAERLALCQWVAGRGLLGVAKEAGFLDAALYAYSAADTFAGAVA